jgi:hypothetical protein
MMKKTFYAAMLATLIILPGCTVDDTDSSPYAYDTQASILYGSNQTTFKEILFYLKPYILVNGQKEYVATDTLLNIVVKVNTLTWSRKHSLPVDTSAYDIAKAGHYFLSPTPVSFPVVATYQTDRTIMTQAGHYADLLLNHQTLTAGDYLLRVESFDIKLANGTTKKVATPISMPLKVEANMRSTYLGEFEVQIRP